MINVWLRLEFVLKISSVYTEHKQNSTPYTRSFIFLMFRVSMGMINRWIYWSEEMCLSLTLTLFALFCSKFLCVPKHIIIITWNTPHWSQWKKGIVYTNWNNKLSTIVLTKLAYVKCQWRPFTSNQCSCSCPCSCTSKNKKAFLFSFIIFSAS